MNLLGSSLKRFSRVIVGTSFLVNKQNLSSCNMLGTSTVLLLVPKLVLNGSSKNAKLDFKQVTVL